MQVKIVINIITRITKIPYVIIEVQRVHCFSYWELDCKYWKWYQYAILKIFVYGLLQWLLASLQHSRGTKEFPSRESQLLVILKFIPSRNSQASGQDGGVGRHTVPPRTTKRQTTTIKKKNKTQNWQRIELYGSPTTNELKKKHSYRLVGGAEMGTRGKGIAAKW